MKTKILSGLFVISLIFITACNWVDPGMNVDPTSPKDATFATVLPTTQAGIAYVLGGDVNRFSSLFTQQHEGVSRQHLLLYEYLLNESDLDNAWNTMYPGPMKDLYNMIDAATAKNAPYYSGVARIQLAYTLGMWTDILGDIPYSQAFKGDAATPVANPKYDKQQDVYAAIHKLLNDGIADCGKATSVLAPKSDDFIYGGKMANWIKAAHALNARFYLHEKNYSQALAELATAFTSNADDMQFNFGADETIANPLYQFMSQRGDISMGPLLMKMMGDLKDPRIVPFTGDTVYSNSATPGPFFASPESPVFFITFAECKFIEAECKFATSDKAGAFKAYTDGVAASLSKFGVDDASAKAYTGSAKVALSEATLTLEAIMSQKYIANYTSYECWTDVRRTKFPVVTPIKGTTIPRRFVPPQSERLFNGASLSASTGYVPGLPFVWVKTWWDSLW